MRSRVAVFVVSSAPLIVSCPVGAVEVPGCSVVVEVMVRAGVIVKARLRIRTGVIIFTCDVLVRHETALTLARP